VTYGIFISSWNCDCEQSGVVSKQRKKKHFRRTKNVFRPQNGGHLKSAALFGGTVRTCLRPALAATSPAPPPRTVVNVTSRHDQSQDVVGRCRRTHSTVDVHTIESSRSRVVLVPLSSAVHRSCRAAGHT